MRGKERARSKKSKRSKETNDLVPYSPLAIQTKKQYQCKKERKGSMSALLKAAITLKITPWTLISKSLWVSSQNHKSCLPNPIHLINAIGLYSYLPTNHGLGLTCTFR